ncbi:MAG: hypothetical protein V1659_04220 [Candidatus Woesearchaeota archaeon]
MADDAEAKLNEAEKKLRELYARVEEHNRQVEARKSEIEARLKAAAKLVSDINNGASRYLEIRGAVSALAKKVNGLLGDSLNSLHRIKFEF